MRARACCDAGSMGRFLRSIIAVMLDVRWRPEDFIVMVVVFCFRALWHWCCAASLLLALQGDHRRGDFFARHTQAPLVPIGVRALLDALKHLTECCGD